MTDNVLFSPVSLGALHLKHRVVMAPLTRLRSSQPGDVPNAMNATYYAQRASEGGLQITEATDIMSSARGYPGAPGIYSREQIAGWKRVTEAVHAKKGLIAVQIWHTGRISHSSMQPNGALPVAPSAIAAAGTHMNAQGAPVPFETPRALRIDEIRTIVETFRQAAVNAHEAGFDAVEIHGANGYLINQFLQDGTNKREDEYGGSIANRARFLLEIVDAVSSVLGVARVGVRLSPWGKFNDMYDSNPDALYDHVASELDTRGLAYLHLVEPRADLQSDSNATDANAPDVSARIRANFRGKLIAAGGFTRQTAIHTIESGTADAIAFGRSFVSNPDLPERLRRNAPLNPYDRSTFYGGTEKGYTDYLFLEGYPETDVA